jgi:hypothetical protein
VVINNPAKDYAWESTYDKAGNTANAPREPEISEYWAEFGSKQKTEECTNAHPYLLTAK